MKMGLAEENIRRIHGDGLSLKLSSNEQILEITGDGCCITVAKNCGSVRVLGDGCRLRIDQNLGDVEYTGDGGRVLLGPKSARNNVKYTGDGGKVTVDGESKTKVARNCKCDRSYKKIGEKVSKVGVVNRAEREEDCSSSVEERENVLNAKKEAKSGPALKQKEVGRSKTITVFHCEEELVSRWFVNPGSVIKSFDGAALVKVASRETKAKSRVK